MHWSFGILKEYGNYQAFFHSSSQYAIGLKYSQYFTVQGEVFWEF
jgi:hypothetical protein